MQRKAFTIIELLVVVAIIALLVTILVPALSHAKRQAKILAVNSDLYQIGLALEMYMDDHNGKHPTRTQRLLHGLARPPAPTRTR